MKSKFKALLLTAILGAISVVTVNAQETKTDAKTGVFGIKGGYNLSSIRNADGDESNHKSGFHIGVYGESFINNTLSIQPEIMYSQQGYQVETESYKLTQKVNYLNVPLMFKVYPTAVFYLEFGPQIGFAIAHKEEFESFLGSSSRDFTPNSFNWGANAGLGFKTKDGITFGARYHYGLGEINDETDYFNNVLQLSVGVSF